MHFRKQAISRQNHWRGFPERLENRVLLTAVTWTIDADLSTTTIAIPDQPFELVDGEDTYTGTLQVRNTSGGDSGPWNVGNSAHMTGTFDTEYTDGVSIEFSGPNDISGINSGSYIPDPANWNGTDFGGSTAAGPGVFGGRLYPTIDQVFGLPFTVGYFNFTDLDFGIGSTSLPISAGTFPANTTDIGIASALVSLKGTSIIIVGQVLPDTQATILDLLATNQSATATITSPDPMGQPNLRRLTFPILQDFSLELSPDAPPVTGTMTGQIVATATLPPPSSIVGRHIFYNQSKWDGNDAAINPTQEATAIATDKSAYLPGAGIAVFDNVTSFTRGINGIMVDISGTHPNITTDDFIFKVGNDNVPSGWTTAPAPAALSVVAGGGVDGSDRVEIVWATGSITNQWLEVQVLATADTGLPATDVHFWGSKVGDNGVGTGGSVFSTTTGDAGAVFANILGTGSTPITNIYDYNRIGGVSVADASLVFSNISTIRRINITGPPFAPEGAPDAGDGSDGDISAVASALAARTFADPSQASGPGVLVDRPHAAVDPAVPQAPPAAHSSGEAPRLRRSVSADSLAADLALDDELLDSLLERF